MVKALVVAVEPVPIVAVRMLHCGGERKGERVVCPVSVSVKLILLLFSKLTLLSLWASRQTRLFTKPTIKSQPMINWRIFKVGLPGTNGLIKLKLLRNSKGKLGVRGGCWQLFFFAYAVAGVHIHVLASVGAADDWRSVATWWGHLERERESVLRGRERERERERERKREWGNKDILGIYVPSYRAVFCPQINYFN